MNNKLPPLKPAGSEKMHVCFGYLRCYVIHTCRWLYTDHILTGFKLYLSDILQAQPGDV